MIRNIIFDLGGVLVRWHPEEFVRLALGEGPDALAVGQALFASEIWENVDRGLVSERQATAQIRSRYPQLSRSLDILLDVYKEYLTPLTDNIRLLEELKREDYRLYLLSNVGEAVWSFVSRRDRHLRLFDGLVLSYREKTIKPEAAIYQILLQRYRLTPGQSLFIDDRRENILAAEALGIQGLLLPCNGQAADILRHRLDGGTPCQDASSGCSGPRLHTGRRR